MDLSTSYILAVESKLQLATKFDVGSNVTPQISLSCPLNLANNLPLFTSQMLHVLSNDPVMILSHYGLLNANA